MPQRTILFGLNSEAKRGLKKQIEENRANARFERSLCESFDLYGNGRWKFYRSDLSDYMDTFSSLCSVEDIRMFLRERKNAGKGVYVLDFMGEGTAIRGLEDLISGGGFVTLTDLRSDWKETYDREHNIHALVGDVLLRDTWRGIDRVAEEFGGFDLIFCRPAGGLNTAFKDPRPYMMVFEKLVRILKGDGGMLLTQVPNAVAADKRVNIPAWILEMAYRYPKIEIKYTKSNNSERCAWYVLCLVKSGSPKRITSSLKQPYMAQLATA